MASSALKKRIEALEQKQNGGVRPTKSISLGPADYLAKREEVIQAKIDGFFVILECILPMTDNHKPHPDNDLYNKWLSGDRRFPYDAEPDLVVTFQCGLHPPLSECNVVGATKDD